MLYISKPIYLTALRQPSKEEVMKSKLPVEIDTSPKPVPNKITVSAEIYQGLEVIQRLNQFKNRYEIYDIKAMIKFAQQLKFYPLVDWLTANPDAYKQGIVNGFDVD